MHGCNLNSQYEFPNYCKRNSNKIEVFSFFIFILASNKNTFCKISRETFMIFVYFPAEFHNKLSKKVTSYNSVKTASLFYTNIGSTKSLL